LEKTTKDMTGKRLAKTLRKRETVSIPEAVRRTRGVAHEEKLPGSKKKRPCQTPGGTRRSVDNRWDEKRGPKTSIKKSPA